LSNVASAIRLANGSFMLPIAMSVIGMIASMMPEMVYKDGIANLLQRQNYIRIAFSANAGGDSFTVIGTPQFYLIGFACERTN